MAINIITKDWSTYTNIFGTSTAHAAITSTVANYSNDIDLSTGGWEGAHVVANVIMSGTRANVTLELLGALTTAEYDTIPLFSQELSVSETTAQVSFIIRDVAHTRLNLEAGATGDSHTAWVYYKPWRWRSS